jgi:hypothetical protein
VIGGRTVNESYGIVDASRFRTLLGTNAAVIETEAENKRTMALLIMLILMALAGISL